MNSISKSTRHSRIIGDFGELAICNWLSRSGFEVVVVDHTGIDVIACLPGGDRRLGITVKSRTRTTGREDSSINIFSYQNGKNDRLRAIAACDAFACEPWLAVYVEATERADIYLTSLANYDAKYRGRPDRAIDDWKMGLKHRRQYETDPDVKHVTIRFEGKWSW